MSDFLSEQWFENVNQHLEAFLGAALPEGAHECQVVVEFTDVPEGLQQGLTLRVSTDGVSVRPENCADATATVRMSYVDALAVSTGQLDSASALREGRIKVRGDVTQLISLTAWFQSAWGP